MSESIARLLLLNHKKKPKLDFSYFVLNITFAPLLGPKRLGSEECTS